jgi:hypothetical protein
MFLATLLWISPFIYGVMDLLVCGALAWIMRLHPGMIGNFLILDADATTIGVAPVEYSAEPDDSAGDDERPREDGGKEEESQRPGNAESEPGALSEEPLPANPYDSVEI